MFFQYEDPYNECCYGEEDLNKWDELINSIDNISEFHMRVQSALECVIESSVIPNNNQVKKIIELLNYNSQIVLNIDLIDLIGELSSVCEYTDDQNRYIIKNLVKIIKKLTIKYKNEIEKTNNGPMQEWEIKHGPLFDITTKTLIQIYNASLIDPDDYLDMVICLFNSLDMDTSLMFRSYPEEPLTTLFDRIVTRNSDEHIRQFIISPANQKCENRYNTEFVGILKNNPKALHNFKKSRCAHCFYSTKNPVDQENISKSQVDNPADSAGDSSNTDSGNPKRMKGREPAIKLPDYTYNLNKKFITSELLWPSKNELTESDNSEKAEHYVKEVKLSSMSSMDPSWVWVREVGKNDDIFCDISNNIINSISNESLDSYAEVPDVGQAVYVTKFASYDREIGYRGLVEKVLKQDRLSVLLVDTGELSQHHYEDVYPAQPFTSPHLAYFCKLYGTRRACQDEDLLITVIDFLRDCFAIQDFQIDRFNSNNYTVFNRLFTVSPIHIKSHIMLLMVKIDDNLSSNDVFNFIYKTNIMNIIEVFKECDILMAKEHIMINVLYCLLFYMQFNISRSFVLNEFKTHNILHSILQIKEKFFMSIDVKDICNQIIREYFEVPRYENIEEKSLKILIDEKFGENTLNINADFSNHKKKAFQKLTKCQNAGKFVLTGRKYSSLDYIYRKYLTAKENTPDLSNDKSLNNLADLDLTKMDLQDIFYIDKESDSESDFIESPKEEKSIQVTEETKNEEVKSSKDLTIFDFYVDESDFADFLSIGDSEGSCNQNCKNTTEIDCKQEDYCKYNENTNSKDKDNSDDPFTTKLEVSNDFKNIFQDRDGLKTISQDESKEIFLESKVGQSNENSVEFEPKVVDYVEFEPKVVDSVEFEPKVVDTVEFKPKVVDTVEFEPKVVDSVEFEPKVVDSVEFEPKIKDSDEFEPKVVDSVEFEPKIVDTVEFKPKVRDSDEFVTKVEDSDEFELKVGDSDEFEPKFGDSDEFVTKVGDSDEFELKVGDSDEFEPKVGDSVECDTKVEDSDEFDQKVEDSDEFEPKIKDSLEFDPKIKDSDEFETKVVDSDVFETKVENSLEFETKVVDSDEFERKIVDSDKFDPKVVDSVEFETKVGDFDEFEPKIENSLEFETKVVDSDEFETKIVDIDKFEPEIKYSDNFRGKDEDSIGPEANYDHFSTGSEDYSEFLLEDRSDDEDILYCYDTQSDDSEHSYVCSDTCDWHNDLLQELEDQENAGNNEELKLSDFYLEEFDGDTEEPAETVEQKSKEVSAPGNAALPSVSRHRAIEVSKQIRIIGNNPSNPSIIDANLERMNLKIAYQDVRYSNFELYENKEDLSKVPLEEYPVHIYHKKLDKYYINQLLDVKNSETVQYMDLIPVNLDLFQTYISFFNSGKQARIFFGLHPYESRGYVVHGIWFPDKSKIKSFKYILFKELTDFASKIQSIRFRHRNHYQNSIEKVDFDVRFHHVYNNTTQQKIKDLYVIEVKVLKRYNDKKWLFDRSQLYIRQGEFNKEVNIAELLRIPSLFQTEKIELKTFQLKSLFELRRLHLF